MLKKILRKIRRKWHADIFNDIAGKIDAISRQT
jgi:hypothetical protein